MNISGVGETDRLPCVEFGDVGGREELRIVQEDVHVTAFAMINLQHHRGAAAERPMIDELLFRVDLPDERARHPE